MKLVDTTYGVAGAPLSIIIKNNVQDNMTTPAAVELIANGDTIF